MLKFLLAVVLSLSLSSTALAVPKQPSSVGVTGPYIAAFMSVVKSHQECADAVHFVNVWEPSDGSKASLDLLATVWRACYDVIVKNDAASDARFLPVYYASAFCYGLYVLGYDTAADHLNACNPLY